MNRQKIQLDKMMKLTLQEETKQFKKQLALVTQKRDILKKACKVNCWNNAVFERFFHTLKTELT